MALAAQAAQDFVPIKEIRDGIVVLRDGSMRAMLLASSINLSLKSLEEQQATLEQFQTFLNSLDFSVQIAISSRKLDIRPYLMLLEDRMKENIEPLLKVQTREYMAFIQQFTEEVAIMKKQFIVVVPYGGGGPSKKDATSFLTNILGGNKKTNTDDKLLAFEEQRTQLEQRIAVVEQGLSRVGVRTVQLGTEEAIELFYKVFNPGEISGKIRME